MPLVETVRHAGAGSAVLVCKGAGAQTETPPVHYTFDVELIFGHCIQKPFTVTSFFHDSNDLSLRRLVIEKP